MNTTGNSLNIIAPGPLFNKVCLLDHKEFPKPWSLKDWRQLNWQHHFLFVQQFEQVLIGFVLLSLVEGDDTAHLLKICFASKARGNGHAQTLWDFSLKEMKKKNTKSVYLEVEVKNLAAIKFYQKVGFSSLRKISGFYSDGGDALSMQLTI